LGAAFYSTIEIVKYLKETGFLNSGIIQTVFETPDKSVQLLREGYGEGSFVVTTGSIKMFAFTNGHTLRIANYMEIK